LKSFFLALTILVLIGCQTTFKPRKDQVVTGKNIPTISVVRTENADLKVKLMNLEEDLRIKDGKIEELEVYISSLKKNNKESQKDDDEVLKAYKDSVESLLLEKKQLLQKVSLLQEANKNTESKLKSAITPADELLKQGDEKFAEKKWTEAVSLYQSYREKTQNKKSKDYAMATYKIGVSFQELGLTSEAKTFYISVTKNFEGAEAYKYAKYRLTQLESNK